MHMHPRFIRLLASGTMCVCQSPTTEHFVPKGKLVSAQEQHDYRGKKRPSLNLLCQNKKSPKGREDKGTSDHNKDLQKHSMNCRYYCNSKQTYHDL